MKNAVDVDLLYEVVEEKEWKLLTAISDPESELELLLPLKGLPLLRNAEFQGFKSFLHMDMDTFESLERYISISSPFNPLPHLNSSFDSINYNPSKCRAN